MEYNTSLPPMIISEYGRNIQRMIDHACEIENREERNKAAKAIIEVMGQLNPHLRDVNDFKHKLWDHLFVISKFRLDVDSPYPIPSPETFQTKPERVKYPRHNIRFKHYGKIMEDLINKAATMEAGEARDQFVENLANTMKSYYMTWNKDNVDDSLINEQLRELSNQKLEITGSMRMLNKSDIQTRNVQIGNSDMLTSPGKRKKKKHFKKKY